MVVCCAAYENRARPNGVSIFTGTTKSQFSRIRGSIMPYSNGTKFTVELASSKGRPHFKFEWDLFSRLWDMCQQIFMKTFLIFFFFLHTLQNRCYSRMWAPIWLKFGWHLGGLRQTISINIGINLRGVSRIFQRGFPSGAMCSRI